MNEALAEMIKRKSKQEIVVEYDAGVGELGVLIKESCKKYYPMVSLKHLVTNIELNLNSHGLSSDYYKIAYRFQNSHRFLMDLIKENGPDCKITVIYTNYEAQLPLVNRKMSKFLRFIEFLLIY